MYLEAIFDVLQSRDQKLARLVLDAQVLYVGWSNSSWGGEHIQRYLIGNNIPLPGGIDARDLWDEIYKIASGS